MFSFVRTVMDTIQSATGMKVKPKTNDKKQKDASELVEKRNRKKKSHTQIPRVPRTSLDTALYTYKKAIATAKNIHSDGISTSLIEEDFVFSLQGYCAHFTLKNGQDVLIRPILPSDIIRMREVLSNGEISQHSLSLRFNAVTTTVKDPVLKYFTNIDYDSHFAIAAMICEDGIWKGVATARFIEDKENPDVAEWSAIVLDQYHGLGIGSCLLYYLSIMASQSDIHRLSAIVHSDNYPVLHWMKKLNAQQEFSHGSRFWFFNTHIHPSWIPNEVIREVIRTAATGKSSLKEDAIDVLRGCVKELNNPEFIQIEEKKIEQKTKISKTKQQTKEVHFVLVEDDFDIGDIF